LHFLDLYVIVELIRTHAVTTPKPCQDRKVAAIRDACDRRGLRVFFVFRGFNCDGRQFFLFPTILELLVVLNFWEHNFKMPLGDIVQKALYLGVGLASYATEKAGTTLIELKTQAQKLADEMVARGEMNVDEARKFVDDIVKQAQQPTVEQTQDREKKEPRRIEILDPDEEPSKKNPEDVDVLRQQVEALQEELRRLKRD